MADYINRLEFDQAVEDLHTQHHIDYTELANAIAAISTDAYYTKTETSNIISQRLSPNAINDVVKLYVDGLVSAEHEQHHIDITALANEIDALKRGVIEVTDITGLAIDLSGYATLNDLSSGFNSINAALAARYTNEQVDNAIAAAITAADIDLTGYATVVDMTDAIVNAFARVDEEYLSDYYNRWQVDLMFANVANLIPEVDLSPYPNLSQVNTMISAAIAPMATQTQINTAVALAIAPLASRDYVDLAIANADVDLTGYATEQYVTNAIAGFSGYSDADTQDYLTRSAGHIIPNADITYDLGSPTNRFRDLYLSGNTIYVGDATLTADGESITLPADSTINGAQIPPSNLTVQPEILEIQVNAQDSGQDVPWLFTWLESSIAYSRIKIDNIAQKSVPLYENGQYTINNFAHGMLHSDLTQTHTLNFKWIEGAGTQNNIIGWVTQVGELEMSNPAIMDGMTMTVFRQQINVPSFPITVPNLVPPSVTYNVSFEAGYKFGGHADGIQPSLGPWYRGGTYTFNMDATGHPLYLTTDNGSNFAAGEFFGEYTTGVTGSRTESGTITVTVPMDAPDTLFYQCGYHIGMRGAIEIRDLEVQRNEAGNIIVYAQHGQEGMATPVELRPVPKLASQMCIVYDENTQLFVPQDLVTYIERTPALQAKIREIAGTATLVDASGDAIVSQVVMVTAPEYLPYTKNVPGDMAYDRTNNMMYIWEGTAWEMVTTDLSQVVQKNTDVLLPYDLAYFIEGPIVARQPVGGFLVTRDVTVPANAPGSLAKASPALPNAVPLDIKLNGDIVGTVTFTANVVDGVINIPEDIVMSAGDILKIVVPDNVNSLNDSIVITLVGSSIVVFN